MAGVVGIDPGPFTLRELLWMADSKLADSWGRSAQITAMIYNANRGENSSAATPDDFNPYRRDRSRKPGTIRTKCKYVAELFPNRKK